ncbi:hypothetical protein [Sphaerochaeta sp. PS]|uniref:hypothetical protein n=1 Tax=Sphaerochaeta sp. PS TaxID=3076336 RepID=UPI0028A515FB|nr:hypothetical protein [Sphaerochaeta sp. PS]MDT4761847.1 hypothetical protein [Sphaerochaeta sp. PS]
MIQDQDIRVSFFSKSDLSCSFFLSPIESILNNSISIDDLSDAIELFNVKKFIDAGVFSLIWTQQVNDNYKSIVSTFPRLISSFMKNKKYGSNDLDNLGGIYKGIFWELITTYNLFKNWDSQYFIELSKTTDTVILLKHRNLINKFNTEISERLIFEFDITAELIIELYFISNYRQLVIYFPSDFNNIKIELIIQKYISDSMDPNLNYLRALLLNKNAGGPALSTKTKLAAKKKCEAIESRITESGLPTFNRRIEVAFNPAQLKKIEITNDYEALISKFSYSSKWITDHLNPNTILSNFRNLFSFVDAQFRIALTNKKSQKLLFERYIFPEYKNSFAPSHNFNDLLALEKLQMQGYCETLEKNGIRLEVLLKNFYEEGLETLFSIKGFQLDIPSANTNYFEKCRTILPEIDKLLKQFNIFVEDGMVDQELIQMESETTGISDVKSLVPKKYFIADERNSDIKKAIHSMFSDQCMLHYVQRFEKSYKSFYLLVTNEFVTKTDYVDIPEIILLLDWLIDRAFITAETNGQLRITDRSRVLYDLYQNEIICFWYNSAGDQKVIDELEAEGLLQSEETLFAKSERDMFNYLLNHQIFSDSLHLRNDYAHGTQTGASKDDLIHKENYLIFLIIIVDITLKITEEIYLSRKIQNM